MDWINELCDLYDKNLDRVGTVEYMVRKGKKGDEQIPITLLPVFHTTVAAQITIDINDKGEFLGAERVPDEDKMTIIPVTETSGSRTAGIEAHPFCDNLKYLAGDYMNFIKTEKKDFTENNQAYMKGIKAWHLSDYTHKKVNALYAYMEKGRVIADLVGCGVLVLDECGKLSEKEKIQNVQQVDSFVRFRIIEKLDMTQDILNDTSGKSYSECWLDKTLQDSYISYYRSTLNEKDICYLTGDHVPVSYLQPKKIRNEGDGAKLISANDENNYTFRGRFNDKKEAFAIGFENSQKIHNALKWIIRKQGRNYNDLCIVIWESDLQKIPEWSKDTDDICEDFEEEEEYEGTGEVVAEKFQKAMTGYGRIWEHNPSSNVVILAFDSATTGRLAMIENRVLESSRYIENICYWHDSCEWLQIKYKNGHRYEYEGMAGIKDIAEALYGTEQNGVLTLGGKSRMYAEVCKRLFPCVSNKKGIPQDMVNLAIRKASSPVSFENRYNWEKVLSIACSFVKKQRLEKYEECWKMEVNKESTKRDYLYGRLLAVADRIEYRTYDREQEGKRVTNARRYMNAFSQHPYQTWKILEEQIQPYLQKLDVAERIVYNNLLDEIYHLFNMEDFTNNNRLEGLYLLGYHSQSYELKYKEESKEEK